jgi:hypothetical protein
MNRSSGARYSGFAVVEKGKQAFADLSFLARAVDKDPFRQLWRYAIMFKGNAANATDGKRLHRITMFERSMEDDYGITDGNWQVMKANKNVLWLAKLVDIGPDIDPYKVDPTGDPAFTIEFEGMTPTRDTTRNDGAYVDFVTAFPTRAYIQRSYLMDIGAGRWRVNWYSEGKAMTFVQDRRFAMVMPFSKGQDGKW